ncbi:MAG: hypothetical protein KatS3mg071_0105 [Meiothermus sp.]|nr:MAG: hypothetical protein KatS3mg071_0105 [Meiothermus sp.]
MSRQLRQTRPGVAERKIWPAALLGGVLSVVGNLLVFVVAGGLGVNLQVTAAPGSSTLVPLQVGPVVLASLLPAFPAAALLKVLARFLPNPWPVFLGLSAVLLLVSLRGPLNLPTDPANEWTLNLMHLVSAVAIVGALWGWARR